MKVKELKTIGDFENLKNGDYVACEFYRDVHDYPKKPFRFKVFQVYKVLPRTKEVVWQKKNNIYSNYGIFLGQIEGESNLLSASLVQPS